MEQKFALAYYVGIGSEDFNRMEVKEIEWMYGRLVKQRQDENESQKELRRNPR